MLRSMFSAISGLRAHQTKMDVVGNNIANVNTVGYKSQTTVFEDTLSQILRNGSAPTADTAGTNPAQVGLGVKVAGITTNFSQGSTQNTGRSTDFMISGDGFFMTKAGGETLYTRAGSFDFDGVGNLVTPDGSILQGWMADTSGTVNTNGPVGNLSIPYGQSMNPAETTASTVAGNLSAEALTTDAPVQTQAKMYDALGNAHQVTYVFQKTATANAWELDVLDENGNTLLPTTGTPPAPTLVDVKFDAAGKMTSPSTATSPAPVDGKFTFDPTSTFGSWAGPVTVDLSSVTQFGARAPRPRRRRPPAPARPSARCRASRSATTARSPASTPTACASRSASWPWRRSPTPAASPRPATAPTASVTTPATRWSAWPARVAGA